MRCKITDWYGLHNGYMLNLRPGYTALVGPNGAGKTTLLLQLREIAQKRGWDVLYYSNLEHGGKHAQDQYLVDQDFRKLAMSATCSEGEAVAFNFSNIASKIGAAVRKAIETGTPLLILLDSVDSGISVDQQRALIRFFHLVEKDIGVMAGGNAKHEIYLVVSCNNYELAQNMCIDVRTGKSFLFHSYKEFADFICNYEDTHPRPKKEREP